jgi:uncharacterized membrane protein HdeD (DUF308 family)
MIVKNIYTRVFVGTLWIAIGLALVKVYFERSEDSMWGDIYRTCEVMMKWEQTGFYTGKIFLLLGCLLIVGGLVALFFGFRTSL